MTNEKVAENFAKGVKNKGKNSTGSLYYNHNVIYSYGPHFPVAILLTSKIALFNSNGYSATTAQHKSKVLGVLLSEGWQVLELPLNLPYPYYHLRKKIFDFIAEYFEEELERLAGEATRATKRKEEKRLLYREKLEQKSLYLQNRTRIEKAIEQAR